MGRDAGVTREQLERLIDYENADVFTPRERLALRLADAMADTPSNVPTELYAELRREFSPAALVELSSSIAWEHYRARFNRVFDVQPQGYSEGAFCPLPAALNPPAQ